MIRILPTAALILMMAPWPCSAQGGGGTGGGMPGGPPASTYSVKVEFAPGDDQVKGGSPPIEGQLAIAEVVIDCDLGLYRIKSEMVRSIALGPYHPGEPKLAEGIYREGTVEVTGGEKFTGRVLISRTWEVRTELGSLKPNPITLRSIEFLGRAPLAEKQPAEGGR